MLLFEFKRDNFTNLLTLNLEIVRPENFIFTEKLSSTGQRQRKMMNGSKCERLTKLEINKYDSPWGHGSFSRDKVALNRIFSETQTWEMR